MIDLEGFTQQECNDLLKKKGFYKKDNEDSMIPDAYLVGPYAETVPGQKKTSDVDEEVGLPKKKAKRTKKKAKHPKKKVKLPKKKVKKDEAKQHEDL